MGDFDLEFDTDNDTDAKESSDGLVSGDTRPSDFDLPESPPMSDVRDILSLSPSILMDQASRIHGIMVSWTEYAADVKSCFQHMKLARDTRLAEAKSEARFYLKSIGASTAKDTVDARAMRDPLYQDIARDVINIEATLDKAKGVVNAVFTKREMTKSLLYSMGESGRIAVDHTSEDDTDYAIDDVDI